MQKFNQLPFQLNSIYANESETNTEQGQGQKNVGSGNSITLTTERTQLEIPPRFYAEVHLLEQENRLRLVVSLL